MLCPINRIYARLYIEYYNFSYFEELLNKLEHDSDIISFTPDPAISSDSIIIPDDTDYSDLDMPIPHKKQIDYPVDNIIFHIPSHSDVSPLEDAEIGLPDGHSISSPSQGKNVVASPQDGNSQNSLLPISNTF